jgi:hypothetical protein
MIAKDKNNRTIEEADWIESNGRIYQVNEILQNNVILIWLQFIQKRLKVKQLKRFIVLDGANVSLTVDPIAYNVTDE